MANMTQFLSVIFNRKLWLAFVLVFSSAGLSARTLSDLDAVNTAAWERTLTMRMAKAYTQLAADLDGKTAQAELNQAVEEFSQGLAVLEQNAPNSKIHQRILTVKKEWESFRTLTENAPTRDNLEAVLDGADELMYHTDSLVREWKNRLPNANAESIDLANGQSMLSERIGVYYAARAMGLDSLWVSSELEHTVEAYEDGMAALQYFEKRGQFNTALMAQLNSNWEYAKMGLSHFQEGHFVPTVIAVTMESMFEQTNTLGASYHVQERIAMNANLNSRGLAANMPDLD